MTKKKSALGKPVRKQCNNKNPHARHHHTEAGFNFCDGVMNSQGQYAPELKKK
jgi:hypothetical protein